MVLHEVMIMMWEERQDRKEIERRMGEVDRRRMGEVDRKKNGRGEMKERKGTNMKQKLNRDRFDR